MLADLRWASRDVLCAAGAATDATVCGSSSVIGTDAGGLRCESPAALTGQDDGSDG